MMSFLDPSAAGPAARNGSDKRNRDLEYRLDTHFATLHSSQFLQALKRRIANWQVYAAVSGSALAMATGAPASLVSGGVGRAPDLTASVRMVTPAVGSNDPPGRKALQLALAGRGAPGDTLPGAKTALSTQASKAPVISAGGVVPIYGTRNTIQPGEWISIYGTNLATQTASWNGEFPTVLAGTSVTINGKPGYLSYVSPTLINVEAPDDTTSGPVSVDVTTPTGTATSNVILNAVSPSFSVLNRMYVAGLILRSDHSGAYGGGAYDILGPTGVSFGYKTVAAQPGDVVELFGVGFGPTTPSVPAGKPFVGAAPVTNVPGLLINNIPVQTLFVGISNSGLYQINLIVPQGLGQGLVPIQLTVAGMQTQVGVYFPLEGDVFFSSSGGYYAGGGGGTGGGGFGSGFGGGGGTGGWGGSGGGTGGGTGGGGGSGGGGSAALHGRPYLPRMTFPPKTEKA